MSQKRNFYPRSPCGERLHYDNYNLHCVEISIHALLAESDRVLEVTRNAIVDFYPRSPCGERRLWACPVGSVCLFLSTLSLRRATDDILAGVNELLISIHALLAESDLERVNSMLTLIQFLSTLSLRRATTALLIQPIRRPDFYPRSPCGERLYGLGWEV